jgi:hypothetical protein
LAAQSVGLAGLFIVAWRVFEPFAVTKEKIRLRFPAIHPKDQSELLNTGWIIWIEQDFFSPRRFRTFVIA